jgi:hypothetical protein
MLQVATIWKINYSDYLKDSSLETNIETMIQILQKILKTTRYC